MYAFRMFVGREVVPDVVGAEVHQHDVGGPAVEPGRQIARIRHERIARVGAARPHARARRLEDVGDDVAAVALVVAVVAADVAAGIAVARSR